VNDRETHALLHNSPHLGSTRPSAIRQRTTFTTNPHSTNCRVRCTFL
jgi:hypothetical protein